MCETQANYPTVISTRCMLPKSRSQQMRQMQAYTRFDDTELPTFGPNPEPPPVTRAEQMTTVKEVREQLRTCDASKTPTPDDITIKVLKSCYFEISPLFDISNQCLCNEKSPIM